MRVIGRQIQPGFADGVIFVSLDLDQAPVFTNSSEIRVRNSYIES